MARWARIQKLPDELRLSFQNIYSGYSFLYEARDVLADWIERQSWGNLDFDNPEHIKYAHELMTGMILELNMALQKVDNIVLRQKLEQLIHTIQYNTDAFNFIRFVNDCLTTEERLLGASPNIHYMYSQETKPFIHETYHSPNVMDELGKIQQLTHETEQFLRKLIQDQEQLILRYQDRNKCKAMVDASSSPEYAKLKRNLDQMESSLKSETDNVMKDRISLVDRFHDTLNRLNGVQNVFEKELISWHRGQQESGNGTIYSGIHLDELQMWCEGLAEFTWHTRQHMQRLQNTFQNCPLPQVTDRLYKLVTTSAGMLDKLVRSSFVIEKQPPQVMKTNTRFTATVRLLVGGKLNIHMKPPNVSVYIISENQAHALAKSADSFSHPNNEGAAAGEILNNTGMMEYHVGTKQLTGHFRNMQLKKIKRTEKKGTESVMDEKFALLFFSRFNICNMDIGDFQVCAFSLPVVVIVHGNQEPHAHATITWDNAFAPPGRALFHVPDKVPFLQVGQVLSQKFISSVGYGLSEDNLKFLAAKALRTPSVPDLANTYITWSQFSKEPLPDRSFTFWEWFYAILKVTKEHLRNLWNDKCIIGFIWRKQAEEMLGSCQPGTFLLRFSDSELGGLTVAWKIKSQDGSSDEYYMLQPFTSRDFQIRGLADRLNDLKHLTYLYPDIPKDMAFGKYYTHVGENSKTLNGYVKPYLVTCVPGLSGLAYSDSYPNTPQSSMQPHSPSESSMHYEPSNSQLEACPSVKNGTYDDADPYHASMMELIQANDGIDFFTQHKH